LKSRQRPTSKTLFLFALVFGLLLPTGAGPRLASLSTTAGSTSVSWTGEYTAVQYKLPNPGSEPWEIATAPDGDVWFVEQGTNALGEYIPSNGTIRQYSIPTPESTPDGVAVDSAGDVWFTELNADKLGMLAAGTGRLVEYSIPSLSVTIDSITEQLGCGPVAVLPDPSGSVWVGCIFSSQIDEFFPSNGTFARYTLPVFDSSPVGLVLDGKGDIWFTAANAYMLGEAVISKLSNGTTNGITEFPPVNDTYPIAHPLTTSFLGTTKTITSSLPYPSGIAMDSNGDFWITEHVDSSFDRYNPATKSIVRYWTSQTYDSFGYDVSFPNGIAVDSNGTVWIGEHYGNKVAQFNPSTQTMVEYPLTCCGSNIAGLYAVTLNPAGGVWFVEINGNAIGDLVRVASPLQLSLTLPQTAFSVGTLGSLSIPLRYSEGASSLNATTLALGLSGISATGELANMTGAFGNSTLSLSPGTTASTDLSLNLQGVRPGIYDITLGASAAPGGVVYSVVLVLKVSGGAFLSSDMLILLVAGIAVACGAGGWVLTRRYLSRGRWSRRRQPSRQRVESIRYLSVRPGAP
jgi:streptogramin lyase